MGKAHLHWRRPPIVKVQVIRGKKEEAVELAEGATAEALCSTLGLLIDAHIVLRNNVPIPMDEVMKEGELIKIIRVASGG